MGDGEFAILAIGAPEEKTELACPRIRTKLQLDYGPAQCEPPLSVSLGFAAYDPQNPCSLKELLPRAERSAGERKKHNAAGFARAAAGPETRERIKLGTAGPMRGAKK